MQESATLAALNPSRDNPSLGARIRKPIFQASHLGDPYEFRVLSLPSHQASIEISRCTIGHHHALEPITEYERRFSCRTGRIFRPSLLPAGKPEPLHSKLSKKQARKRTLSITPIRFLGDGDMGVHESHDAPSLKIAFRDSPGGAYG